MRGIFSAAISAFLLAPCAWSAIAVDATVSRDQSTAISTNTTPSFSTSTGQELLLAFISTDYVTGANTTVQSVSGAGLTWALVVRTNVQSGSSEIWRAFSASALTAVTVTATLSQSVQSSMTVMSFSGVDASGTNGSGAIGAVAGANATSGAPSASLLTTRNNSWVIGVGNDFDNAIARAPANGQKIVHQVLTSLGDTYWVQMQNSPTAASGTSVSINDTAPTTDRYNLSICEILPPASATQTWTVSGSITPASLGAGTTVSLAGSATAQTTADAGGNYSFSGLSNGSYTVTPSKTGLSFTPASQNVTVNGANQSGINFTVPTWSISGTITPSAAASATTVGLSGAASAVTSPDTSGNYTFSGLPNGNYTVTPTSAQYGFTPQSQPVTIKNANATAINFSGTTQTTGLAIDAKVSADQAVANTTVTSPAFSTSASQELLVALISTDYLTGSNTTVSSISGGGLVWTLVVRTNAQSGSSEIWRAFAPTPLSGISVTATLSQKVQSSMTVMSFSGVDPSGAIGAVSSGSASSGAPKASLITTRNNSWVIGVGNDFDNAIARTPGPGQTLVHQDLTSAGDTYWVQMQTGPTPVSGTTVSINDTAPVTDRYNLSICEILPASGGGIQPVPPTVTMTSPATGTIASLSTVSASVSDNVGIVGVQFLLDGAPLGGQLTSPPWSFLWDTKTTTNGTHTLTVRAQNSAGQMAVSSGVTVNIDNSGNPAVVGSWSSPVSLPAVAVNLILLRNNKVLFYQDGATPTVWDYSANTFTSVPLSPDLFCSGAALLPDGRVFVAGGFGGGSNAYGIANAEIFDPATNKWTAVPNMAYRRWYPGVTTLSDGRVLVTAGWQTTAHSNAGISEIYNSATNSWTSLTNANNPFETYPFLYQLHDGRVIHIGGSEYATDTDILDINSQTWTVVDSRIIDGGSATMYLPERFMKAGAAADSQNTGPGSNTTFVLDMTQPNPAWQQTPSMAYVRSFLNLTMLPDGTALATGGETDKNGGNIANAVYAAELWSPQTQTWRTMASMSTPREYHGTALLLPDGRVLESGMGADFGNVPDEKSAEFYSPPYLFKGPRPTITQAPSQLQYGANFFVGTPDATSITSVVLIRTGAVTHFFDHNERFVPLAYQQSTGGLTVTAPANAYLAPPGYYMLFLVNSSGVPSIAPFVQLPPN